MPHYTNWFASMTSLTVVAGAAISLSYIGGDAKTSLSTAESTLGTTLATASSTFNTSTDSLGADSAASTALLSQTQTLVLDENGTSISDFENYFTADSSVANFSFMNSSVSLFIPAANSEGTADEYGMTIYDAWPVSDFAVGRYPDNSPTLMALAEDELTQTYTVPAVAYLTLNDTTTTTENIDLEIQFIGTNDGIQPPMSGDPGSGTTPLVLIGGGGSVNLSTYIPDPDNGETATYTVVNWRERVGPNNWGTLLNYLPAGYNLNSPILTIDAGTIPSSNVLHRIQFQGTDPHGTSNAYFYLTSD